MEYEDITHKITGSAYHVYNQLARPPHSAWLEGEPERAIELIVRCFIPKKRQKTEKSVKFC